jgi:hypothetical protein
MCNDIATIQQLAQYRYPQTLRFLGDKRPFAVGRIENSVEKSPALERMTSTERRGRVSRRRSPGQETAR